MVAPRIKNKLSIEFGQLNRKWKSMSLQVYDSPAPNSRV